MKTYLPIALFILSLIILSWVLKSNKEVAQPVKQEVEDDGKVKTEIIAVKVPEKT